MTTWLLLGLLVSGAALFVATRHAVRLKTESLARQTAASIELSGFELALASDRVPDESLRPIYRHSVIPGGAYTQGEVADAMTRDAVVAAHYAGLDTSKLRIERVTAPRSVHMSYRIGDEVFWTKEKIALHVGETILTDGTTSIRARCGNCFAAAPLGPSSDEEPAASEFAEREDDVLEMPTVLAALPPGEIGLPYADGVPSALGPATSPLLLVPGGTPADDNTSGAPRGNSVPLLLPIGGGGGGGGEGGPGGPGGPGGSGGPDDPGTPGGPGNPGGPGEPGGPGGPGGPGDPGGPGNPENPLEPEGPGDPGGPGGPGDPQDPPFFPPTTPSDPGGPVSVPEPSTLLLMGVGGAGLAIRRFLQGR